MGNPINKFMLIFLEAPPPPPYINHHKTKTRSETINKISRKKHYMKNSGASIRYTYTVYSVGV